MSVFKEILLTAKTVAVKIKLFVSHHDFIYGEFLLAILRMGMLIYHQAPARSLSLLWPAAGRPAHRIRRAIPKPGR